MPRYSNIIVDPGVNIGRVNPRLLNTINSIARARGQKVTINSGYRSPAHSVAVGGFANDPHTRGVAVDAYIGGRPIGDVIPPSVWAKYGVESGDVPNFYNGRPDPEHLQLGGAAKGALPKGKALAGAMMSGKVAMQSASPIQSLISMVLANNQVLQQQQPSYRYTPF